MPKRTLYQYKDSKLIVIQGCRTFYTHIQSWTMVLKGHLNKCVHSWMMFFKGTL